MALSKLMGDEVGLRRLRGPLHRLTVALLVGWFAVDSLAPFLGWEGFAWWAGRAFGIAMFSSFFVDRRLRVLGDRRRAKAVDTYLRKPRMS